MQSNCEQVILCCFLKYNKNFKLTVLASGQLQLYQTKTRQLCKYYIFGIHNHENRWDYSKDYTDGKQLRTKPALTITQCGPSFKRCQKTTHVVSDSLWPHGLGPTRLLCPWNFPGKNTGVGYLFLLQGSFPTQGSNSCLLSTLHWKANLLLLELAGKPKRLQLLLLFRHSVMSSSLWPHGLQHTSLPCPSPSPGACSDSWPMVGDAIQPSHPLSHPSPPARKLSQHQGLFQSVCSSHQVARVWRGLQIRRRENRASEPQWERFEVRFGAGKVAEP